MSAKAVLAELERAGIRVRLTDQGFAFKPRLDGRLRAMVATHTADLLSVVDREVAWRVATMRPQLASAAAMPLLLARPHAGAFAVNACISCGDPLTELPPPLGSGRCRPCRVAVSLIAAAFLRQAPAPLADARPAKLGVRGPTEDDCPQ